MKTNWYVGVDIGGTTIKFAFIDTNGQIIEKWEATTNVEEGGKYITSDIAKEIFSKVDQLNVDRTVLKGIGVGAPGFINLETGFIYEAVNIGWKDFHLKKELEEVTGLPVVVDNDANLAALGEMWLGAGEGAKDLLCVTLGTGVGGGIISNGQIVHGFKGMAGEIGHYTSIPQGGVACNCGKTGCLETIASATGIARLATEALQTDGAPNSELSNIYEQTQRLTAKNVFDTAKNGDALAVSVIDEISTFLGLALANMCAIINPEKIVIGGGVSKAGDFLIEAIKKQFKAYAIPLIGKETKLVLATLGNDAGVIGAVWLIKQQVEQKM